jgi:hypothetical protein
VNMANGQPVLSATVTEIRDGKGGTKIVLKNRPVTNVSQLTIGGIVIPASPDGIQRGYIMTTNGIELVGCSFVRGVGNVYITYTGGFAAIPDDVQQAVIELASQKYRRRAHIDQSAQSIGPQHITFSSEEVPREVRLTANNYKSHGFIE